MSLKDIRDIRDILCLNAWFSLVCVDQDKVEYKKYMICSQSITKAPIVIILGCTNFNHGYIKGKA